MLGPQDMLEALLILNLFVAILQMGKLKQRERIRNLPMVSQAQWQIWEEVLRLLPPLQAFFVLFCFIYGQIFKHSATTIGDRFLKSFNFLLNKPRPDFTALPALLKVWPLR